MADHRKLDRAWHSVNPLRQHRRLCGLYLRDIGAAVGAGYHTVYRWEKGMSVPSETQMAALAEVTQIRNLSKKWQRWLEQQPVLGKGDHEFTK